MSIAIVRLARRSVPRHEAGMEQDVASGRVWGARTAIQRRDSRRGALIRAAIVVYGAIGYRQATVKAVCERAGLTERYFYESFANSEDLLQACFLHVTRDLLARMRAASAAAEPTGLDRVRAGLRVYFTALREHPAAARVFLIELASVSPATEALVSASLDEFGALLLDVLQPGPNAIVSPLLLRGVVGGGLHIAQAWISSAYAASTEEAVEAALRLYAIVDGSERRPSCV